MKPGDKVSFSNDRFDGTGTLTCKVDDCFWWVKPDPGAVVHNLRDKDLARFDIVEHFMKVIPEYNPGDWVVVKDGHGEFVTELVEHARDGWWVTSGTRGNPCNDMVDPEQIIRRTRFKPGDKIRLKNYPGQQYCVIELMDNDRVLNSGREAWYLEPLPGVAISGRAWEFADNLEHLPEETSDAVNPSHYKQHPSGLECHDITKHLSFDLGNAIKYLWRAGLKPGENPSEPYNKALWYVNAITNSKSQSLFGHYSDLQKVLAKFGQWVSTPKDGVIFALVQGALNDELPSEDIKNRIAELGK